MIPCERCEKKFDPGVDPGAILIVPTDCGLYWKHHYCRKCGERIAKKEGK